MGETKEDTNKKGSKCTKIKLWSHLFMRNTQCICRLYMYILYFWRVKCIQNYMYPIYGYIFNNVWEKYKDYILVRLYIYFYILKHGNIYVVEAHFMSQ